MHSGARVFAVGGGKGGTGHTLVGLGIAVFLAQLGKKVLLVDAHPRAAVLGATLGVVRNPNLQPPWCPAAITAQGHDTVVPSLRLLEVSRELGVSVARGARDFHGLLLRSGADVAVVDLGPGVSPRVVDGMLSADVMLTVTTPEPVAIEAVYRLVRHAYARRLARRLRALPGSPGVGAVRAMLRRHAAPPLPIDLAEAVAAESPELAREVWSDFGHPRLRVVVNESRLRADLELGDALCRVSHRPFGGALEYLGHVEYDDAVYLAGRRRRPLLVDAPSTKAARNLERVARRLLALETGRPGAGASAAHAVSAPTALTHYEVLALDRGASDEEIRRAYRKTREIWSSESVALAGLLTEEQVSTMVARIEEARDVLLDPARRRPYDLSITPQSELRAFAAPEEPEEIHDVEEVVNPPLELTPDTEYTGALLRALREAKGVKLEDVALRTKISGQFLRALEEEDFAALPPAVYTRGFVTEVAKALRLDVEQVVRSYLQRYRKALEAT